MLLSNQHIPLIIAAYLQLGVNAQYAGTSGAVSACRGVSPGILKCLTDVSFAICNSGREVEQFVPAGTVCQPGSGGAADGFVGQVASTTRIFSPAAAQSALASQIAPSPPSASPAVAPTGSSYSSPIAAPSSGGIPPAVTSPVAAPSPAPVSSAPDPKDNDSLKVVPIETTLITTGNSVIPKVFSLILTTVPPQRSTSTAVVTVHA